MQLSVVYEFVDAPTANRFLNHVNASKELSEAKAKLFARDKVRIHYSLEKARGFDRTLSDLDDLASQYGGTEYEA